MRLIVVRSALTAMRLVVVRSATIATRLFQLCSALTVLVLFGTFALGFLVRPLGEAAGWTRIGVSDTRSGLYIAIYLLHALLYTIYLLAALY